jgi:Zn-dependent peptidase ImmA (M78 family)
MNTKKAQELFIIAKNKYNGIYPVPVKDIAIEMGIDVYTSEFTESDKYLGYIKKADKQFSIHINKENSQFERDFTIAHEIGHFVLHQEFFNENEFIADYTLNHSKSLENHTEEELKMEQEANSFAAELLIPELGLFGDNFCINNNGK